MEINTKQALEQLNVNGVQRTERKILENCTYDERDEIG